MKTETPKTDSLVKEMRGWQQSARANNLAHLCRKLEKQNARMLFAGQRLSNIAFNWAQDSTRPERDRQTLDQYRRKWDESVS